jgi:hypothetical protein
MPSTKNFMLKGSPPMPNGKNLMPEGVTFSLKGVKVYAERVEMRVYKAHPLHNNTRNLSQVPGVSLLIYNKL